MWKVYELLYIVANSDYYTIYHMIYIGVGFVITHTDTDISSYLTLLCGKGVLNQDYDKKTWVYSCNSFKL